MEDHLPSKANNGPLPDGKQKYVRRVWKFLPAISWPGKIKDWSRFPIKCNF